MPSYGQGGTGEVIMLEDGSEPGISNLPSVIQGGNNHYYGGPSSYNFDA
jgi:hypothetical protein